VSGRELRKAALLLDLLDEAAAESLLSRLPPAWHGPLRAARSQLDPIDPGEHATAVAEFLHACHHRNGAAAQGSLSPPINRPHFLEQEKDSWDSLSILTTAEWEELLSGEGPATLAVVLPRLSHAKAAELLSTWDSQVQVEVVRLLSSGPQPHPEVAAEVAQALCSRAEALRSRTQTPGLRTVSNILQAASQPLENQILAQIAERDQHLAGRLTKQLDARQRLEDYDDAFLVSGLRELTSEIRGLALAGLPAPLVRRLLAQLPESQAEAWQRSLEQIGMVRLSDVDGAREDLLRRVRELAGARRTARAATELSA